MARQNYGIHWCGFLFTPKALHIKAKGCEALRATLEKVATLDLSRSWSKPARFYRAGFDHERIRFICHSFQGSSQSLATLRFDNKLLRSRRENTNAIRGNHLSHHPIAQLQNSRVGLTVQIVEEAARWSRLEIQLFRFIPRFVTLSIGASIVHQGLKR